MWDPNQYRQFGDERSRAFYELISRIGATDPQNVADIGCGPGELTVVLSRRWPDSDVVGVDSSAEMIAAADEVLATARAELPRLRFEHMDARDWKPAGPVDVIVSNAMLQWIPDHESLLVKWVDYVADGGWLAFQVPANHDEPTHRLIRELARTERWSDQLSAVALTRQAANPADYLDLLTGAGCVVDAWETTYLHVLTGEDPVLRWISGTGLRPVITSLEGAEREEFLAEYGALLRQAYPAASYGTAFPFRRVFAVARKP
ncbi:MAG TPA: trans-aconitate 2-methyltransferase [Streptosporangiaceae bacterium]|nr:trans-aconitate 2-methyltransferase [Streptosporangiaceae bacterium]